MLKKQQHQQEKNQLIEPSQQDIFKEHIFRLGIFAPSQSGKSQLLTQIITDSRWGISDRFKPSNIYVFCPTINLDQQYQKFAESLKQRSKLKKYEEYQFDQESQFMDENIQNNLVSTYQFISDLQKDTKQEDRQEYLFILDDIIGEIQINSQSSILNKILTKGRHLNLSIIISLHAYKTIHPLARQQFTHLIIFQTSQSDEYKKLSDAIRGQLPQKQFAEIYTYCTNQQYQSMLVYLRLPVQYRFFTIQPNSELQQLML